MANNNLSFNDCAALLASINKQATGREGVTPTDLSSFVSVATTTLATGYDNVINAISQVLSRTIFSVRPYNRKFAGLYANEQRYGNHVRKLTTIDSDPASDQRQNLTENGVDQQKINKPKVIQTNFYGANTYQRQITLFKDQLDVAFSSPAEFGAFVSMIVQNVSDQIEQDHENCARATLCNFIAGKIASVQEGQNSLHVVHLLTEYKNDTGLELTAETVRKPENYGPFIKWAMAFIRTLSTNMTERNCLYHTNLTDKPIPRHTPMDKQKVYMLARDVHNMEAQVFSSLFHDEYLKKVDFETVNYWQSIVNPGEINVTASYMKEDGTIVTKAVNSNNVFGVIADEEALGYTVVNQWSASAPFNAAGGYTNTFYHFTDRYWNDFTENGIVLLLE